MSITLTTFAALHLIQPAHACAKDTDCKGDRICEASACVDPVQVSLPVSSGPVVSELVESIRVAQMVSTDGALRGYSGALQMTENSTWLVGAYSGRYIHWKDEPTLQSDGGQYQCVVACESLTSVYAQSSFIRLDYTMNPPGVSRLTKPNQCSIAMAGTGKKYKDQAVKIADIIRKHCGL